MQVTLQGFETVDTAPLLRVFAELERRNPEWLPTGHVTFQAVDEPTMRELNKAYAGNDYATDVLTFNYQEEADAVAGSIADVAICLSIAEAQAHKAETTVPEELATLGLHATLHIAGFDHATTAERDKLDALQADILEACGITYRDFAWEL